MHTYFISYSRDDQDFSRRLVNDLADQNFEVFFDQTSIEAGSHWTSTIQSSLEACECLLLVLSPRAVASRNVLDETRYAVDHGKRIVPQLYEECEIPFRLWRTEHVGFQGLYQDSFSKLLVELRKKPTAQTLPVNEKDSAMGKPRLASSRNLVISFDHQMHATFNLNGSAFILADMAESVLNRQAVYYPGNRS